jgi:hypothetical protein
LFGTPTLNEWTKKKLRFGLKVNEDLGVEFLKNNWEDRIMDSEKKQKRLTIVQLRGFSGLENLSEEDAESAIATLEKLSVLFYELYQKKVRQEKTREKVEKCIKIVNIKKNDSNGTKRNAA